MPRACTTVQAFRTVPTGRFAVFAFACAFGCGAVQAVGAQSAPRRPESLQPLTIGGAARAAAERSGPALASRARTDQATARVTQRRADLLPQLSGTLSDAERTLNSATLGISFRDPITGRSVFDPDGQVLGPVRAWDARLSLRQAILDPAAFARWAAAQSALTAARADGDAAAQFAGANAALAAVMAMRATALVSARLADSALAAELVEIARAQLRGGIGIALDITRAEATAASVRSQLASARAARARSEVELARAVGLPASARVTLADSLAGAALPDAGTEPDRAARTTGRADLRAANAQVAAAGRQVRAVQAERLPALSLYADDGAVGKSTNHLLNTYSWGISLGVPAFDGLRREGRIAEQRAVLREAEIRRRELDEQLDAEAHIARLDLAAANELLGAARERERLAVQEVAQARERLTAGVAGNAEIITASLNLSTARAALIDARASALAARIAIARADGTILTIP
ncbi:MAG: TolC family protein [Gemmatimonadetes bacterium]|nr:TolC family protein [Gemmatimonadota bacterium]